jgi:UDPglucose 6-dehydrogenase
MHIAIVGTGRVGLVTGVALAGLGHDVVGMDASREAIERLQRGRASFFEPGLQELLDDGVAAGRLRFTTSIADALEGADVVFICVGRPVGANGDLSLTSVEAVARDVARHGRDGIVVVVKSTVPPGTCERIERTIRLERPALRFHVASSPEFLREGFAIQDTLEPDRIVVGAADDEAFAAVRRVYRTMIDEGCVLIETERRTAELAKLASNAFLATKLSFANAVARVCELTDADMNGVAEVLGADPRIGPSFLRAGIGYGGYCLPKDVDSLRRLAERHGYAFDLLKEVTRVNDDAAAHALAKIEDALWNLEDKRIVLLGLAFKAGTDDVRSAPALVLARALIEGGADVVGCDPMAADAAREVVPRLRTVADPYEAAEGAHCVVICTEWPEFGALDLERLRDAMAYPVMVDGRNLLHPPAVVAAGFHYLGTGRSTNEPSSIRQGAASERPEPARG